MITDAESKMDGFLCKEKLKSCTKFQKDIFNYLVKNQSVFESASKGERIYFRVLLEKAIKLESDFSQLSEENKKEFLKLIYPEQIDSSATFFEVLGLISFLFFFVGIIVMFFDFSYGIIMTLVSIIVGMFSYGLISGPKDRERENKKIIRGIND